VGNGNNQNEECKQKKIIEDIEKKYGKLW